MARRVLAWQCRYCGALKKSEKICLRHEIGCIKNPNRKNCMDCAYSDFETHNCTKRGVPCSRAVSAYCEEYVPITVKVEE